MHTFRTLSIQDIIHDIHEIIAAQPGLIKKIGVFGSLARGDYNSQSDIDLLVEYDAPPVFDMKPFTDYCRLCNQIEENLMRHYNRKVDIVHIENGSLEHLKDMAEEVVWLVV